MRRKRVHQIPRKKILQYQDNCGRTTTVSVDVTQGSILGPLFLVVNLNNLFYLDYFTAV